MFSRLTNSPTACATDAPGEGSSHLVYIVDDEEDVRDSLGTLLTAFGYRTRAWSDGRLFLRAAKSLTPASVLVDLHLPGISGLQLQDELRRKNVDLPLIFMTGAGDVPSAVRAMRSGALHFLEKPFAADELKRAVEEAVARLDEDGISIAGKQAKEKVARLSIRESEVLDGLLAGLPNKAIAFDLGVSPRTIEVHRASIMRKFGASSFAETLRIAFEAGS